MTDPHDVILAPVVSEKTYDQIEVNNTYTFVVDRRANKTEIRDAVKAIFDVDVVRVNRVPGSRRSPTSRRSRRTRPRSRSSTRRPAPAAATTTAG